MTEGAGEGFSLLLTDKVTLLFHQTCLKVTVHSTIKHKRIERLGLAKPFETSRTSGHGIVIAMTKMMAMIIVEAMMMRL